MKSTVDILRKTVRLKIFGKDRDVPLYVILAVISLAATILLIRYFVLRDQWRTLNVTWYGYSIEYPALYDTQTYGSIGGRGANSEYRSASINSFGPNVLIHQTGMENPDLLDAFDWWQEIMGNWGLTEISSPVETQIGYDNYPAIRQTYYDGSQLVHAYFVVSNDRSYLLEFYRVSEESQPIVDRMLASFKLLEVGGG